MRRGEEAGNAAPAEGGCMVVTSAGTQSAGSAVVGAIRDAARMTGTSFQYLLATAQVESGLNPNASGPGSSAGGLFQFIDQTWLATVKDAGPALGYGRYADAITRSPSGRYEVSDPAMRRQIFALRRDPTANAVMAGVFTQRNAARLAEKLGRAPSEGELYVAHFLGASGAARLIALAGDNPSTMAAAIFPHAAKANPSIFYDRQGNARSLAGVLNVLTGRYDVARATPAAPAVAAAAGGAPAALSFAAAADQAAPAPVDTRPVFHSLFRNDQRGPVSQVVQDLWTTRPTVAAALTGMPAPPVNGQPSVDLFSDQPSNAKAIFGAGS
jgi:hypothetical protein